MIDIHNRKMHQRTLLMTMYNKYSKVKADPNPRRGEDIMILQMPHSFRWGDRAGVGISKIFAESVYDRCPRLACYVPMSGGERQIRHFSSAFILMYAVSFIIYITV